jgi:L,D-transpeptidase YcbB
MRLTVLLALFSVLLSVGSVQADEPALSNEAGTAATQHLMPSSSPASAAASSQPVETGSIELAPPPNADIGAAARAMIPVPKAAAETALAPAAVQSDTKPDTAAITPPPTPELTLDDKDQAALSELYTARKDEPLWVSPSGYSQSATALIAEMANAADWGLEPSDYTVPALATTSASRDDLAKAEMGLSLALLRYARDARGARIPQPAKTLSSYLDRTPQVRDRKVVLETLAKSTDPVGTLLAIHPQHADFIRLRQAWLEVKRGKTAKGVQLGSSDIKPGESGPHVVPLRKRMATASPTGADEARYDEVLVGAVRGFQSLKGLEPNGIVDAATRRALSTSPKGDANQLLANMQLWRWMPEDLGSLYVNVNVPEFMIRVIKNGAPVFTERVTVGLVDKQTPIFSDSMERVTFKSIWNVPDSIKVKEIWPSLIRGGGLMRQHNLRIRRDDNGQDVDWRSINWARADMKDYDVYRPSGANNQLGLVKFSFPSKHYVFMHDTNEKYMFNWSRRANSHGCMRVRNPLSMAKLILNEDKGWDGAKIDGLVKGGPDHNVVELDRKIPVHITYFTARVDEKGEIKTWADVYGHQKRITQALKGEWTKISMGRDHLAPLDQSTPPRVAVASRRVAPKKDESVLGLLSAALGGL